MRVLAVETSSLAGGVALLDDERLIAEYVLDVSVTHSERLMAAVDRVLGDARWTPRMLDALAVAVGPGSFTGLRIAISTVKGLAVALGVPIAAVPTLDAMAATVPWAALPVCPVLDARKGEIYASLYRWDAEGMRREWDYLALAPDALAARLSEPVILLGDGAAVVRTLDGLAVAVGPGSFTGLRIAVSTVKGLAFALGVPIAAVPTLDAMAAALPWAALPVCPVLDARKGEVYASLYRWDGEGMRRDWDYLALAPDALAARLSEPVILLGDGAAVVRSPHARALPSPRRVPSPACVGALGLERLRRGDTVAAAALEPIYLRPSEAELKRRVLAGA